MSAGSTKKNMVANECVPSKKEQNGIAKSELNPYYVVAFLWNI